MSYLQNTKSKISNTTTYVDSKNWKRNDSTSGKRFNSHSRIRDPTKDLKCINRKRIHWERKQATNNNNLNTKCNSKCSALSRRVISFLLNIIWTQKRMRCKIGEQLGRKPNKKKKLIICSRKTNSSQIKSKMKVFSTNLRLLISNQRDQLDKIKVKKVMHLQHRQYLWRIAPKNQ